jgi:hypothetical protein
MWRYDGNDLSRIRPLGSVNLARPVRLPAASATILVLPRTS